jgi:hypothetical protein
MPVYVDNSIGTFYPGRKTSHMVADTVEELHAMADKISVKRTWFFQGKLPHYDVSQSKRAQAIKAGAIEINFDQLLALVKKYQAERQSQNLTE